ncbi:10669_t:CDS:2 [Paraglomus occultum]|uniref:10669_t:CDS:1 n=1 Tax=Paraglomus occultum TaxID=144539 RepID=A0A9N9BWV6_9GLOM|nr:10669_t:CDS:2 [Paraglomus occultum]
MLFIFQYNANAGESVIFSNEFTLSTGAPVPIDLVDTAASQSHKNTTWQETWISLGTFSGPPLSLAPLDVVYSWVNGSDPRHVNLMAKYSTWRSSSPREAKHYRDYDELRYSIRSIESMLGKYVSNIVVVSADYGHDEHRNGQVPQWLNMTWKDKETGKSRVHMVHHSQVFVNKTDLLPTFNSLAIESQIVNINGLSDQFLYFNDDLFLGAPLLPTDFYTPLFGYVLHTEQHLTVAPSPRKWGGKDPGEWFALEYTNYLLSKRFGRRDRVYVSHSTHILSPSILREITSQWKDEFYATASHKFRGESPEIHTTFMFTHYIIEKHRETLLKAFFFYKMDVNHDNNYNWAERSAILNYLRDGRAPGAKRVTISSYKSVMDESSLPQPRKTTFTWSAFDGFPYQLKSAGPFRSGFYDPDVVKPDARVCGISLEYCLGRDFMKRKVKNVSVEDVFMSVAYEKLECGDCIIHMLVGLSGEKGVKAFLPESDVEMDIDYIERVDNLGWKEKTPTETRRDVSDTVEKGEPSKTTTEYGLPQKSAENNLTDYDSQESSDLVENNQTGDEDTTNDSTEQESSGISPDLSVRYTNLFKLNFNLIFLAALYQSLFEVCYNIPVSWGEKIAHVFFVFSIQFAILFLKSLVFGRIAIG